jgi:hypothetical protein
MCPIFQYIPSSKFSTLLLYFLSFIFIKFSICLLIKIHFHTSLHKNSRMIQAIVFAFFFLNLSHSLKLIFLIEFIRMNNWHIITHRWMLSRLKLCNGIENWWLQIYNMASKLFLHPRYYLCFKVIQWHIVGNIIRLCVLVFINDPSRSHLYFLLLLSFY